MHNRKIIMIYSANDIAIEKERSKIEKENSLTLERKISKGLYINIIMPIIRAIIEYFLYSSDSHLIFSYINILILAKIKKKHIADDAQNNIWFETMVFVSNSIFLIIEYIIIKEDSDNKREFIKKKIRKLFISFGLR